MYLCTLEWVQLLLINFSIPLALLLDPLAPAVIYLHSVFLPLPSRTNSTIFLPISSSGACIPAMGYCFSNLADRGQYLCIVFRYSFLLLTQASVWPGHKSTAQTLHLPSPPDAGVLFCVCPHCIFPSVSSTENYFYLDSYYSQRINKGQEVRYTETMNRTF